MLTVSSLNHPRNTGLSAESIATPEFAVEFMPADGCCFLLSCCVLFHYHVCILSQKFSKVLNSKIS